MCFHLSNTKPAQRLEKHFKANFKTTQNFEPYYHRAAYEDKVLYIIKQSEQKRICPAFWGIMPEHLQMNNRHLFLSKNYTYNARVERLFTSTLYQQFIKQQRCLIIADGFFEPHKILDRSIPYYFKYQDHSPFAFAGIYSELIDGSYTATIITTVANSFFSNIHNVKKQGTFRMPLVLDPAAEDKWLNTNLDESSVKRLTSYFTLKTFEAYPVSRDINKGNINTDHAKILDKVNYPELDQLKLF